MVIIREGSIGDSVWSRIAGLDRRLAMTEFNVSQATRGLATFAIPRFFKLDLLKRAVLRLKENLGEEVFQLVRHGDHQLLYVECMNESRSVGVEDWPLIIHIEDDTPLTTVRKYIGYGYSHAWVRRNSGYRSVGSLLPYLKKIEGVTVVQALGLYVLYIVRGASFLTGLAWAAVGGTFRLPGAQK